LSAEEPAKEPLVSALMLHHFADLLRIRHELGQARSLAEEAVAIFRRHPVWPSEEQHALQVLASILAEQGDSAALAAFYPDALAASSKLLNQQDTAAVSSLRRLAAVFFHAGFLREAQTLYRQAAECYRVCAEADDIDALNGLAWLLATCPDATVRDGRRAVALAQRAVELTKWQSSNALDTLAAAYAEVGEFASGVRAEKQAMALLPEAARESFAVRLRIYEASRPFHD
jgi:tetratricopeptide (TPR) repeat protein